MGYECLSGEKLLVMAESTSNINCGIFSGWLLGHVPLTIEKVGGKSPIGLATCDSWLGLSRFTPSQHLLCRQNLALVIITQLVSGSHRKDNVRPDTPGACLLWEMVGIPHGVEAGRVKAASKVGLRETAVALLRVDPQIQGCASHRVASEHTETLGIIISPSTVVH